MLKLFYTGATGFNTSQNLSSHSLGGYISNTKVPNGVLNSLFTPLSLTEIYKNKKTSEYFGFGLYFFFFEEEPSYNKVNLKFDFKFGEDNEPEAELFKNLCQYKVGISPLSGDSTKGYYMETITAGAKPYYLSHDFKLLNFDQQTIFENVELPSHKGIGLWFNRIFDSKLSQQNFGFNSDYWNEKDKLPVIDFIFNLDITFEGIIE